MKSIILLFVSMIYNSVILSQNKNPVSLDFKEYEEYFSQDSVFNELFIKDESYLGDDLNKVSKFYSLIHTYDYKISLPFGWSIVTDFSLVNKLNQNFPFKEMRNALLMLIKKSRNDDPKKKAYLTAFIYICLLEGKYFEKQGMLNY